MVWRGCEGVTTDTSLRICTEGAHGYQWRSEVECVGERVYCPAKRVALTLGLGLVLGDEPPRIRATGPHLDSGRACISCEDETQQWRAGFSDGVIIYPNSIVNTIMRNADCDRGG